MQIIDDVETKCLSLDNVLCSIYRQVRSYKNLAMSSNLYILLFLQLALWRCELNCCSPRISTVELNLPIWVSMNIIVEVWNEHQKNDVQNHRDKQMRRITFNRCKARVTNLCWTWRLSSWTIWAGDTIWQSGRTRTSKFQKISGVSDDRKVSTVHRRSISSTHFHATWK